MAANNLGTAQGRIVVNTSGLKNADIALRSAGTSMVNFGTMALGAFGAIVNEAAKFEKEMDFVQAVTTASAGTMEKLEEAALSLAKNSIYGPNELAKAFVELAKAGASAEQIIDGVGAASVALATAADVEIPFAGENLINILNTFSLAATDATHVADLLAGAANASSVDLQDLVVSFKYAGPVAQGLGITIEELTDAMSLLGKVGIKGSTAGTSLRAIMLRLGSDVPKVTDTLKELGIITADGSNKFFTAEGKAKSLAEVFQILQDATKGLTEQEKVLALSNIFGQRAIPAALELMAQGTEGFKEMNEEIEKTTAADVAAKRMDNLDGSLKRLKATLSALFVEAGGPFQKFLKGAIDGFREFLLFIDRLPGPVKTFVVGLIGAIGVLSVLAGVFLLTIGNIVRMVRVFGEIRNGLALFTGATRAATAATVAQTGATTTNTSATAAGTVATNAAAGAQRGLALTILASPIFWLIAALIALAATFYLLYTRSETFRRGVDEIWQAMQRLWDNILNFIQDVRDKWTRFWEGFDITKPLESIGKAWDAFWGAFTFEEGITTGANNIYGVIERLGVRLGKVWEQIQLGWDRVKGAVGGAFNTIAGFLQRLPDMFYSWAQRAADAFLRFLESLPYKVGFILGYIIGLWSRFWGELSLIAGRFVIRVITEFLKLPGRILSVLNSMVTMVISWGPRLLTILFQIFERVLTFVLEWGPRLLSMLFETLLNVVNMMMEWMGKIPGIVWDSLTGALNFLREFLPQFSGKAREIGMNIVNGIMSFVKELPGKVLDILHRVISAFTGLVSRAFEVAKNFARGLWEGFKRGLGISSPSFIEEAMFAIQAETQKTTEDLKKNVRLMQGLSRSIPSINTGVLGLPTPAAAALTANGGGLIYQQNGPLIAEASIRDERDAVTLARMLAEEQSLQLRARGLRYG